MDDWQYKLYISYQSWYESLIFSYYKFKQAFFIFHDEHYELYISYQRWYEPVTHLKGWYGKIQFKAESVYLI